jgi:hypothetical protein
MNDARSTGRSPRGVAPREAAAEQARGRGGAASRRLCDASRRLCAAVALASAGLTAAGCSAVSHAAAAPSTPTPSATATATAPPPTIAPPASPTPRVGVATTSSPTGPASGPSAAVPTLGQPTGVFAHSQGFGQVKPAKIFNGGDPTGLVTQVVWRSWGGAKAIATGISDYVGPNQTVAEGRQEPVTVVAFSLGICHGRLMYQAVEWYFPRHKQAFDAGRYEDICTGTYVPAS